MPKSFKKVYTTRLPLRLPFDYRKQNFPRLPQKNYKDFRSIIHITTDYLIVTIADYRQ